MKFKEITILDLNKKITKGKRLIFFGGGQTIVNTYSKYPDLAKYTDFILDNSPQKNGTTFVSSLGEKIIIISPNEIKKSFDIRNHIVIFSLNDWKNAHKQLVSILHTTKFKYYNTPIVGLECSSWYWKQMQLISFICSRLPLNNSILFSGWGDSQRENELALLNYLKESDVYNKKYKLIWQCDNTPGHKYGVDEITRAVLEEKHSITEIWKYYYAHFTAKYVIWENHNVLYYRKGQILVYLNHGTPPIKETKKTIVITPNVTYACCPSENVKQLVSEQYSIDINKLIVVGSPRFDSLFGSGNAINEIVRKKYRKIIIWVPTFRQHNLLKGRIDSKKILPYGLPIINGEDDFIRLNNHLADSDILLLIKPHPLQDLEVLKVKNMSNILLIEQKALDDKKIGINQLLKDIDAMITDYSTIAFDFMLLNRIIGYTIDDLEDYSIGFSTPDPLKFMPGRHMDTLEQLLEFINDVSEGRDLYYDQRNELKEYIHKYQGPGHCKRLVETLNL